MSVAPHAGVVDFGTFTPPTLSLDGIQGEVPQPLIGQENYVLTGNGWSSLAALGALTYQGTWNASTNTPTLVSSVGVQGYYYVVSVAGNTDLNGTTTWDVGDWAIFNGSAWQKIEGGSAGTFQTLTVTGQAALNTISGSTSIADTSTVGQFGVKLAPSFGAGSNWDSKVALFGNVNLASGAGSGAFGVSFDTTQGSSLMSIAPALAWYNMRYLGNNHQFFGIGFEQFRVAPTNSAVNYVQVTGATTSNRPRISFEGSDGNIGGLYVAKGSGGHSFCSDSNASVVQFAISRIASAVNFIQVQGASTGNQPFLTSQGTDANAALGIASKGNGDVNLYTNGGGQLQLKASHTASAVNYVQVTGAATGGSPTISAQGSDTDINITLTSKGAGAVRFQTAGTIRATVDSGGATNLGISASGGVALKVPATGSQVNFFQMVGAATTTTPVISTLGSDTNVALAIQSKGTGAIDLAAGSSGVNISNGGTVTALTRTNVGAGYTSVPTITISPPTTAGGTTATATVTSMGINFVTVVSGGTGYAVNDEILISGGTFTTQARYRITAVSGGVVTTLTPIATPNYQALPTNPASTTTAIGTGSGLTLTVNWAVTGQSFTAGSGYIEQPTVTFSGGGGSGAAAYAFVGSLPIIRTLGAALSFFTPGGQAFQVYDINAATTNYWAASGGATANSPYLYATGSDTNVTGRISSKGTGSVIVNTNGGSQVQLVVAHTASSVNYFQVSGSITGNATGPLMSAQGSDTNIPIQIQGKGTGSVSVLTPTSLGGTTGNTAELFAAKGTNSNTIWLRASQFRHSTGTDWTTASLRLGQRIDATDMSYIEFNPAGFSQGIAIQSANNQPINFNTSGAQFRVGVAASSVNFSQASGGATTKLPILSAQGSDTNVSLGLQSKGTGAINLAVGSLGVNISNGTTVTGTTLVTRGSGYTALPAVSVSAPTSPSGVQAVITALLNLNTLTLVSGGTGYTALDVLTVSGISGGTVTVRVDTVAAGVISTFTITNFGAGSISAIPANPVSVTGGTGTGATFTANWNCGNLTIGTAGSGYLESPTVTFTGGATNATAFASVGSAPVVKGLGGTQLNFATAGGTNFAVSDSGQLVPATYAFATGGSSSAGFGIISANAAAGLTFTSKGASNVDFYTNSYGSLGLRISNTTAAVNYIQVTGSTTGGFPSFSAQGSDANPGIYYTTKGFGSHRFTTNTGGGSEQFRIITNSSATVNFLQVVGSATGIVPQFSTQGTDTNISLAIQSKGTGAIDLAAGSSGVNLSNGGTVTAITRTNSGSNYTSIPSVAVSAPTTAGGVQATLSLIMAAQSGTAVTIANGGTGYTLNDVLTLVGGTFAAVAQFTVTGVSAGVVTQVTRSNTNFGNYTVLPTSPAATTGGTGTGCTLNMRWEFLTTTITNAGSGYIEQPTITFSGGGGSGAAAYATVGSGTIIRSLANTLDIHTPAGSGFQVNNVSGSTLIYSKGVTGYGGFLASSITGNSAFYFGYVNNTEVGRISMTSSNNLSFGTSSSATEQFRVAHTASAVNYVQVTGAVTTGQPTISAQGSDTNVSLSLASKGTGIINLQQATNLGRSSTNWLQVAGSGTGLAPSITSVGGDTDIDLALTPKGTGNVRYGTHTATADVAITGYIEIKDSSGTIRKLAVIT